MKEPCDSMLKERRHVFTVLFVLLLWSTWLAFIAEARIPIFRNFVYDMISGTADPIALSMLLHYLSWWKFAPFVILVLIVALVLIRQSNAFLRITVLLLISLLVLACSGMTFLATEGMVQGVEQYSKQFWQEQVRIEHTSGGDRLKAPPQK